MPDKTVRINVTLKASTAEQVKKIALSSFRSVHDTVILLASTAMKYNYTPDLRYIPCQPQPHRNYPARKEKTRVISLLVSSSFADKLETLMQVNYISSKSGAVRSLVETALLYDYNDKLMFSPPVRLRFTHFPESGRAEDVILLDVK